MIWGFCVYFVYMIPLETDVLRKHRFQKPIAGNSLFCLCIYFSGSVTLQSLRMAAFLFSTSTFKCQMSVSFRQLISKVSNIGKNNYSSMFALL